MAKGMKTGGKDFQPGNKLGKGAAAHNPIVKAVRRLTNDDVADIGSIILEGNVEALSIIKDNPDSTVLRVWIATVALKAIERGDAASLNALLDRISGKVKEPKEISGGITIKIEDYSK